MQKIHIQRAALFSLVAVMAIGMADSASAGTGGTAFDDVWLTITEWTQGTLGRIIAGSMALIGIVAGIARQSMMSFGVGIGSGMGLYNLPPVVESIMTATAVQAQEAAVWLPLN